MNKCKHYLAAIALAGVVGGTPVAHELSEDASMAEMAFTYRDSLFHVIGAQMGMMRAMAEGNMPADDAAFAQAATNIAFLANMIPGTVPEGSIVEGSIAKPEIWEDLDDFNEKAADLAAMATEVAAAAQSGGVAAGGGMLRDLGGACGACHREYKVRTD